MNKKRLRVILFLLLSNFIIGGQDFNVTFWATTEGGNCEGTSSTCIVTANMRAIGKISWLEGFSGHIELENGQEGLFYLPSESCEIINLPCMFSPKHYDHSVSGSKGIPLGYSLTTSYIHCEAPYDLPYIKDIQSVPCNDDPCAVGGGGGDDCPEPPPGGGLPWGKTGPEIPRVMDDCSDIPGGSPLVIDLGQDNFTFGGPESPVLFDLLGYGQTPLLLQWVSPNENDAFLINDINGNGIVDNGSELFGAGTRLLLEVDDNGENPLALNGYIGLQQYDDPLLGGNNDGYITEEDTIWAELNLWLDQNADGISTEEEILTMQEIGLTRVDIIPKENSRKDRYGNALKYWSWTYDDNLQGHNKFKMVDVFFKILH